MSADYDRSIEWAMWANELSFFSGPFLVVSGIIGQISFRLSYLGLVAIVLGCIVTVVEYPRSLKRNGRGVQRWHQSFVSVAIAKTGFLGNNYYIRACLAFMCFLISIMFLPTTMAALCLLTASIVYVVAAVKGEKWTGQHTTNTQKYITQPTPPPV